jgi:hypothetical protein
MTEQVDEIVEQLTDFDVDGLKALAQAIKDLINSLDVSEDVMVGDRVTFEVRDGATLTGLVESTTSKRATVLLQEAEGTYTINLKNVAILEMGPRPDPAEDQPEAESGE